MKGFWARAWRRARENPILVGFIVLGIIARVVFWAATDRKLDDALITLKFDKCGGGPLCRERRRHAFGGDLIRLRHEVRVGVQDRGGALEAGR